MNGPARGLAILVIGGALLIGGIALRMYYDRSAAAPDPSLVGVTVAAEAGGPWSLIDQHKKRLSDRDFAGKFLLVYFGYTYCPDVCPVELAAMAAAIDELGAQGEKVTPAFITIDPDRDTPEKLGQYVASFHPRMLGLTGTAEEIAAAAHSFKVYYRKSGEGEGYSMDHTGFVYFVGPDGLSRAIFRSGAKPEDMAKVMRAQLTRG
jgi:protein SCO1